MVPFAGTGHSSCDKDLIARHPRANPDLLSGSISLDVRLSRKSFFDRTPPNRASDVYPL